MEIIKKFSFMILFAATLLAAACSKTEPEIDNTQSPVQPGTKRTLTISATAGAMTRATFDYDNSPQAAQYVKWELGDKIGIGFTFYDAIGEWLEDSSGIFTVAELTDGGRGAIIEGEMVVPEDAATVQCMAYYADESQSDLFYADGAYINSYIPLTQQYRHGGFAKLPMMAAYNGDVNNPIVLDFTCLFSIIKIPVGKADGVGENITLQSVVFQGLGDITFGPDINIGIGSGSGSTDDIDSIEFPDFSGNNSITLNCDIPLSDSPTDIYIGVPVMYYGSGFSFTFITNHGFTVKDAAFPDIKPKMNTIYTVPQVELSPDKFAAMPDPVFREWLLDGSNGGPYITVNDQTGEIRLTEAGKNLSSIDLSWNSDILSIAGIEMFTNLEELTIGATAIGSVDLSANTKLKHFYCFETKISSLNLTNNLLLEILYCSDTPLQSLDMTRNSELRSLFADGTSLTTIDLSQNTKLSRLGCGGANFSSLDLSANSSLSYLEIRSCPMAFADLKLPTQNNITELWMSYTAFSPWDALSSFPGLTWLYLDGNWQDIIVKGLSDLTELILYTDADEPGFLDLSGCKNLKSFHGSKTYLADGTLDISSLNFKGFIMNNTEPIGYSNLKCVDNPTIEFVGIDSSTFTDLTLTDNPKLISITDKGTTVTGTTTISGNGTNP